MGIHPRRKTFFPVFTKGVGRHGQYGHIPKTFIFPKPPGCGQTVHFGHLDIHEDKLERYALPPCFVQQAQRFPAVFGQSGLQAAVFKQGGKNEPVDFIVLDGKNLSACESFFRRAGCLFFRFRRLFRPFPFQQAGELECGPLADLALTGNGSPHELHKFDADGQSQTGSAKTPRDGGVGLPE